MSFLPARPDATPETVAANSAATELPQPEDDERDESGVPVRHVDDKLQTTLTSEALQKKLLRIYYDARTYEEEQGVSILYLALGFLKWSEAESSDRDYHAPLLLIPIALDRKSATTPFRIHYREQDLAANLSLQEKLRTEFGIQLPALGELDDLSPDKYFAAVRE